MSGHQPALAPFEPGTTKYQMLGVAADATTAELKIAYRRTALLFHPDRHDEADRPLAEQIFKEISAAYRTLSNAETRRRYDRALARGDDYREASASEDLVRLEDILAEIQQYEHVFSRDQLEGIDPALSNLVVENLMNNLGEQVVAVYLLSQPPENVQFRGTFKSGAVVVTNLRVMTPFTYQWEEVSGNVRTTYKGWAAPVAVLPLVTRLRVESRKRLAREVFVSIDQPDRSIAFRVRGRNLAKLLVIASLWGIPFEAAEADARSRELKAALLGPWVAAFWSTLVVLLVAAFVGFVSGAGVLEAPPALLAWAGRTGLAQGAVLSTCCWMAHRLGRWVSAYQSPDLLQMVRGVRDEQGTAPGNSLVTTA